MGRHPSEFEMTKLQALSLALGCIDEVLEIMPTPIGVTEIKYAIICRTELYAARQKLTELIFQIKEQNIQVIK